MRIREFGLVLKRAGAACVKDDTLTFGAALAYYSVFSISPLLIIALSITHFFYKGESVGYIENEMAELIGANAAKVIAGTIESVNQSRHGFAASVVGVATLLIGASSVFVQLQTAMNRIWGVKAKPGHFVKDLLKQRLVSFAMVVGVGFLLLVSLLLSAALAAGTGYFSYLLPAGHSFWYVSDILTFAMVVVVFAAIFKTVPDVHVNWPDVWMGALLSAILFTAGKFGIGFYLGRGGVGSAFGAAGSVLVILAWVYYTSQILFFGAEFTKSFAELYRSSISPIQGAHAVSEEAKARERGEMLTL